MKKYVIVGIAFLGVLMTVEAGRVTDAKKAGKVCETRQGELRPEGSGNNDREIIDLAQEKNNKRRAKYASIAEKTGAALEDIIALVVEEIYREAEPGTLLENREGQCVPKKGKI